MVYFDVNDFDEALLAPANYELSRILTSIFVGFDSLKIDEAEAESFSRQFLKDYGNLLKTGKPIAIEPRTAKGIVCTFLETQANRKMKALVNKRTRLKNGKICLLVDDRHLEIDELLKNQLIAHLSAWIKSNLNEPEKFKIVDVVFRIAGTGSVGVKRFMFLIKKEGSKPKYFLLDMKQAKKSSVKPFVNINQPNWGNDAIRILAIQNRMQNVTPAHLSPSVFNDEPYVVQEMQPIEDRIDFNMIKTRYNDLSQVIHDMAILIASAQLRSSGRQGSAIADEMINFGNDEQWHEDMITFAKNYAKIVQADYAAFANDYKAGLLTKNYK